MGKQYTNTEARQITIGGVTFLPGATETIPSDATIGIWKAQFKHPDEKATPQVQEAALTAHLEAKTSTLLDKVAASCVVKAGFLKPGVVAMPPPAVVQGVQPLGTLADLSLAQAQAQVKMCADLDTLASWHATETRPVIQDLIKGRADTLAKP